MHELRIRPFVEGVWDGLGAPALLGNPPPQQVGWFASRSPRFTKVGFKTISEDHQIRGLSVSQFSLTIPARKYGYQRLYDDRNRTISKTLALAASVVIQCW